MRRSLASLGRSLRVLWASCGRQWASFGYHLAYFCHGLCRPLAPLGRSLGVCWASCGCHVASFGNPCVAVARNCDRCLGLRRYLASLGARWAPFGRRWPSFGCHLATQKSQLRATASSAMACVVIWPLLGVRLAHFGHIVGVLGRHSGVIWRHLSKALACVVLWPLLGARWAPVGRQWPSLGPIL